MNRRCRNHKLSGAPRDASSYITGMKSITNEKAQEYQNAADPQIDLDRLVGKLEAKMSALYPDRIE